MFTKYILPAIIVGFAIICSVVIIVIFKTGHKETTIKGLNTTDGFMKKPYFLKRDYIKIYKAIKEVLPDSVSIQFKVTLDTFIKYNGFDVDKKKILTKYIDLLLVSEDDMMPILAIDLFNYDTTLESMQTMRADIVRLLIACGIPCISLPIQLADDKAKLQDTLLAAIPKEDLIKMGVEE